MLLFAGATYIATSMSDNIDTYVSFVDAQDDLLITQTPQADLDETGQIATADFYAWYGLDELESLDAEYASVRTMLLGAEGQEEVTANDKMVGFCADGTTPRKPEGYKWN